MKGEKMRRKRKMKKWKNLYEFPDGYGAMYNMEDLMLQQLPHLITVMPEEREREIFQWLVNKEVKEGNKKLFKSLLNKEYRKEVQIAHDEPREKRII